MPNDKLKKLQDLIILLQNDTITPKEIKQFLEVVLNVIRKEKEEFSTLSKENIKSIKDALNQIETQHNLVLSEVSQEAARVSQDYTEKIEKARALLEKVEKIKVTPGKDGRDGLSGKDGRDGKDGKQGKDGSPDKRIDIVKKINTGKKNDLKILADQIEGFSVGKDSYNLDRAISILDQRTQFLINKTGGSGSGTVGPGTADEIAYFNSATTVASLTTATYPSLTELSYVKGVTSAIQTQLNAKQAAITAADTRVLFADGANNPAGDAGFTWDKTTDTLTLGIEATTSTLRPPSASTLNADGGSLTIKAGSKNGAGNDGVIIIEDAVGSNSLTVGTDGVEVLGKLIPSSSTTDLGVSGNGFRTLYFVGGSLSVDFGAGDVTITHSANTLTLGGGNLAISNLTASEIVITDASKNIVSAAVATYPSLAELIHLKGVTSAIQTQLNARATTAGALTQFVGNGNWKVFYSDGSGDVIELALGADGTFLKSNGATSAPTFATPAGSGDVSKVGTPVNDQIGVWTGDGTIEGDADFTWSGTTLTSTNTTDDASVQIAILQGDRATMADNDEAYVSLRLSDDAGTQKEVARLTWVATDVNAATSVDGRIDFAVMTAGTLAKELQLDGTSLSPTTTDGLSLGTTLLNFSDLFLDSGAVIDFDGGDVVITHTANTLTFTGGTIALGTATATGGLTGNVTGDLTGNVTGNVSGNAGTVTWADEATDTSCFIGFATASSGSLAPKTNTNMTFNSSTGVATFASTVLTTTDINGGTVDGTIIGGASAAAGTFTTIAGTTITASLGFALGDGDYVGVTSNEILTFATAGTITVSGADFLIADGNGLLVGHTAQIAAGEVTSEAQILGTTETDASLVIGLWSATDALSPQLKFLKNGNAAIGSNTIVADNEELGKVQAYGADGVDNDTLIAEIAFNVDDAAPSAGAIAGEIILATSTTAGTLTTALTVNATQQVIASVGFMPDADDGAYLGQSGTGFSDLFLASGAVINWAAGDVTLTHAAGKLTFGGDGAVEIDFNNHEMTNVDINSGAIDGTTIGAASASSIIGTTIDATTDFTIGGTVITDATITDDGTLTINATTAVSFSDKNITNVGDIALDSLTADATTISLASTLILAENTSIQLDPAGSADGKYSGVTVTGTGGTTIAFGDLIYLDPTDSRWELADANAAAAADGDSRGILGIAVTTSSDGAAVTVLLQGIVRADAVFPALTIGAPVYVSETAGDIVVTQPTTTDVVIRIVGIAITADEIFFNPDNTWTTHT